MERFVRKCDPPEIRRRLDEFDLDVGFGAGTWLKADDAARSFLFQPHVLDDDNLALNDDFHQTQHGAIREHDCSVSFLEEWLRNTGVTRPLHSDRDFTYLALPARSFPDLRFQFVEFIPDLREGFLVRVLHPFVDERLHVMPARAGTDEFNVHCESILLIARNERRFPDLLVSVAQFGVKICIPDSHILVESGGSVFHRPDCFVQLGFYVLEENGVPIEVVLLNGLGGGLMSEYGNDQRCGIRNPVFNQRNEFRIGC